MRVGLFSGMLMWVVLIAVAGWQVAFTVWLWCMGMIIVGCAVMYALSVLVLRRVSQRILVK